jgi:anhydro-N-acetylmuramic acid kinase
MMNKIWYVIGLMSGTSLDGVDLAYVKITRNKAYDFEILQTKSINYSEIWKNKLQEAFTYSGEKLTKLSAEYGIYLGEVVVDLMAKNNIE